MELQTLVYTDETDRNGDLHKGILVEIIKPNKMYIVKLENGTSLIVGNVFATKLEAETHLLCKELERQSYIESKDAPDTIEEDIPF